ncbi:MAG: insulinase family protein [Actinobacteria bacterium]|nr:insulinase family protein [Actinomycetota bacterium]
MKGFWIMLVAFTTMGALSFPQTATSAPQGIFPYSYQIKTLANKLKIILIPMENQGLVSYYSIVRTGSRDEYEKGHTGFAHFFEHMMFRGTKTYPGNVYDHIMTEIGADANAYTTDDYTCFHLNFAGEDLDTVMKLESDRFMNLRYTEQAFKTEAGAVHGEYLKGLSSPWSHLEEKLMETAFKKHTYRHTTIGFRKDIEAMPKMYQYSLNFYKRYYRPENVVLLIIGDINPTTTIEKVQKYYGSWKTGYIAPKIPKEPEQKKERRAQVIFSGRTLPILTLAYKGLAFDPENIDYAAIDIFNNLAFGETSELYKKLVIKEQRVQFLNADLGMNRDPNLITIITMVRDKNDIKNIEHELERTVQKFQKELVSPERLNIQRNHSHYGFLMNLDTPEKVAGTLTRVVAVTDGIDAIDKYYVTLAQVTPKDIRKVANKYFVRQKRTVVVLKGGK